MSPEEATREQISNLIDKNPVMLFMKGNREAPQCGFSATLVRLLDSLVPEYETADVLSDPELRQGIKTFSSWPTIPQLYVRGEFIGGCDIVQELYASGELHEKLGVKREAAEPPSIEVTGAAALAFRDILERDGGDGRLIHLKVDARFQASLYLAVAEPGEVEVQSSGLRILLDPMSAMRAKGLRIDVAETEQGVGFQIENPQAPQVHPMVAEELKALIDSGEAFEFVDVRTPEERAEASIPGATLLTPGLSARLEGLPRDAKMVFHCHHGGRSQSAAEHFARLGFTNVHNLVGGIDAWSERVDPSVPRY